MKSRRLWFVTLSITSLFAGLYSGEKIFFIVLAVLLSMMLYAALTNLWVLLDFSYLQKLTPQKAVKGQKAILNIQIHNDKPFIFPYMKIYYKTPHCVITNSEKNCVLSILPFQYCEVKEEFTCNLRGKYNIGLTRVEVMDLFGLFTFSMNLLDRPYHKQLSLFVYPRVLKLPYLPLPNIQQEGQHIDRLMNTEEPSSISDLRQYRFGDSPKKIHWKLSAKFQEIFVKNYETTTMPQILLFVENRPFEYNRTMRFEIEDQLVECSVCVANYILSRWLPLQLIVYHDIRHQISGKNPQDFDKFYDYMAELKFDCIFPMTQILQIESGGFKKEASIVLIIHHLTESLFNYIYLLRQAGIYLVTFVIQHRENFSQETAKMVQQLGEKDIPSFVIYTDQRIDEALEEFL